MQRASAELAQVVESFSQTLQALKEGGPAPYQEGQFVQLRPIQNAGSLDQIDRIQSGWSEFQANLSVLVNQTPGSPAFEAGIQQLETQSPALIQQADILVRQYESLATARLNRLRLIQIGFVVAAVILLGAGGYATRRSIISPLKALEIAARRIGAGDLDTPIHPAGPAELQLLGSTLENMRASLLASKAELVAWTETLEQRVDQRTQELTALNAVSQEINSQLDIDEVLNSIAEKACLLLKADVAFLCLLDGSKSILKLHAAQGPEDAIEKFSSPADIDYAGQVLASQQAVQCNLDGCHGFCEIMSEPYRHSHLAVSLQVGKRIIGALCVGSQQESYFDPDSAELLTRLANIAAVALENARLYEQAERTASLEERQRIAAEMHDGLAQTLGFLYLTVDQIGVRIDQGQMEQARSMLERVQTVIDQANLDVRRSISRLDEDIPLHFTLQEQLQRLAEECSSRDRAIQWTSSLSSPLVLPRKEMEQVLRVTREALFNAKAHSQAEHIQLELAQRGQRVSVMVKDDGLGFDPENPDFADQRPHFGLVIMRARAARFNADLEIHSSPGKGSSVTLTWIPGVELLDGATVPGNDSPLLLPET